MHRKRRCDMQIETERLFMRELKHSDYDVLCKILQDSEVMYAYEGAFSNDEVWYWLNRQIERYEKDNGLGLLAVILKESGEMIGQCGLTHQECMGKTVLEIGYLFQKKYWHKGYAVESARACKQYAFDVLKAEEVFSVIRDSNIASQKVAERNGMTRRGMFVKHYRGVDMPHYIYSVSACESPGMVRYREISAGEINRDLFSGFIRYQSVDLCYRKVNGEWIIKSDPFIDDWSEEDYDHLVCCLVNTVKTKGVVLGAFYGDILKGFASVESELFGGENRYLDLSCIHVSKDMRGMGIGKELFRSAKAWAKRHGAAKLYISAHSAVESQRFYQAVGCVEAREYNKAHVEKEPFDCQLECML